MGRASRGVGTDAKTGAKGVDRLGASGLASSTALKAGLAGAAVLAAGKLVNFGQAAIGAASALEEQMSGAQVTFGAAADAVIDFADKSSGALGLSRSEALLAANAFGGLFKSAGATAGSSADASESFVRLAADLASFKDVVGGVPVVLEKLRSGLTGEAEPLRSLGVFLNDAGVRAKAAELGLGGAHRELTDGEKIAARYALIIEQTGDAQGDMERTSGSLANQQRQLSADIKRLQEDMGAALVPTVTDVVGALRDVIDVGRTVGGVIGDISDAVVTLGGVVDKVETQDKAGGGLGGWLEGISDKLSTGIDNPVKRWADGLLDAGDAAEEAKEPTADLTKQIELQAQAQEESAKLTEETTKALLATSSAQRAYDASVRAVTTAEQSLTEARKTYNDLLKEGAVDEEKVADARQSLADASRSLASANRRLADVQEDYNEALGVANILGTDTALEDLEDASDDLADAQDGVASAADRQKTAAAELKRVQAGDPEFNDKLAAAKRGVTTAELGFADAQYNSAQRAYELDAVLLEQNTLLASNAGAILGIRNEWDALLARKPEIEAFLKGPMAPIAAGPAPAGATPGPGFGLRQYETPGSSPTGSPTGSPTVNNNQTVNITTQGETDPWTLARQIVWNMN